MHNFQTGIFKTKKRKPGDLLKFFKNPTEPQLNFIHEMAMQHLGHPPSHFWGRQVVPWKFQGISPDVYEYVADATRQPKHEFQRRMLDDNHLAKKGAGWVSNVGEVISDVASTGARYINRATAFIARNQTTIDNAANLIKLGTSVATLGGLIAPSTAARIHGAANSLLSKPNKSGAANSLLSKPDKSGAGWVDFV